MGGITVTDARAGTEPRRAPGLAAVVLALGSLSGTGTVCAAPPGRAAALALNCHTCHEAHGRSVRDLPALAGKSADFIAGRLRAFRAGEGAPTIMDRIARGYSDEEIALIAGYLGTPP